MRNALAFVALLPLLAALDIALWLADPEHRVVRSALLAGFTVGRVPTRAVW